MQNDFSYFKREVNSSRYNTLYRPLMSASGSDSGSSSSSDGKCTSTMKIKITTKMSNPTVISTVSMWLAETYPMTRHLRFYYNNEYKDKISKNNTTSNTSGENSRPSTAVSELEISNVFVNIPTSTDCFVPPLMTFAMLSNICCSMLLRKVPYIFVQSHAATKELRQQFYLKVMVCCAVIYDILGATGATRSQNTTSNTTSNATSSSIFALGSVIKVIVTCKILLYEE